MQVDNTTQRSNYIREGEQILNSLFADNSPWHKARHTIRIYQKDEYIYNVGDPSDKIYLISEGRVKIGSLIDDDKTIVKAIFGENDLFGEMALTGESLRIDYAQATEDNTKILSLSKEEVLEMMKVNKSLSEQIFQILGARIRRTEKRLESLLQKDARTRIVEFLRDLALDKGKKVGFETMIKNYFTHKDMASLTGTSRQTVTTVLNDLKDKNIINFDRRRFLIRDMELLN
ncbi:MAG: Crp/Fnr family transcriptional regulator [Cyclobacteriaceae bacterium]